MKNILDYKTDNITVSKASNQVKLISALKEDFMWQIDGNERIDSAVAAWLKIDNSDESKNQLFANLIEHSIITASKNMNMAVKIFNKSFVSIKDNFSDLHSAFIWKTLILSLPSNTPYKYLSLIQNVKSNPDIPDLKYSEFKKSVVNLALENKKSRFLNLLYLIDKTIFKPRHIITILNDINLYEGLKEKVSNIKFPLVYNKTVENILIEGLKQLNNDMTINSKENIYNFLYEKITIYSSQANLGSSLLPLVDSLQKNDKQYINLKEILLHNKMEHELVSKSNFRRTKI